MIATAVTAGAVVALAFLAGLLAQANMTGAAAVVAVTGSIVGLLTLLAGMWFQVYRDREARRVREEEKSATEVHRQIVLETQAAQIELLKATQKQLTDAKNEVKEDVAVSQVKADAAARAAVVAAEKSDQTLQVLVNQSAPPPPPMQVLT